MNNPQLEPEPSDSKVLLSALGWIGVIFLFILIVAIAYLPRQAPSTESIAAAERMQIRNEITAEQIRLVGSYEWINQPEGIVRIPVSRAMELTVDELRKEQQAEVENPL